MESRPKITRNLRVKMDEHLWQNIGKTVKERFPEPDKVSVSLTIPLCIGYTKEVKKDFLAGIIDDCTERNYPYQIVLYKNPNNKQAVEAFLRENDVAIKAAGANVIDAEQLRNTKEWELASKTYDDFFSPRSLLHSHNKEEQLKCLYKDVSSFLQRTSEEFASQEKQNIITDLINGKKTLDDVQHPETKKAIKDAMDHVILEVKDCMARMKRKKSEGEERKVLETSQDSSRLNFVLYDGKLYQSILHVITLAETLGYEKESLIHKQYKVTSSFFHEKSEERRSPSPPRAEQYSELKLFIKEVGPTFADVITGVTGDIDPVKLSESLATGMAKMYSEMRYQSSPSVPVAYAKNPNTLYGNARRSSPPTSQAYPKGSLPPVSPEEKQTSSSPRQHH